MVARHLFSKLRLENGQLEVTICDFKLRVNGTEEFLERGLEMSELISMYQVEKKIFLIRGQKVMLSPDLAALYGVEAKALNQAAKRNIERFPEDFMFQLTKDESENLKRHFATSSWGGARRATPYAFTEHGVAMLSSVLKSKRAIQVNIEIMRAFSRLREVLASHKALARKLDALERRVGAQDEKIQAVFNAIRELMNEPEKPKKRIGFLEEPRAVYRVKR